MPLKTQPNLQFGISKFVFYKPSTPAPGVYEACQSIRLKPGFSFKATQGNSVSLKINPAACSPSSGSGGTQYVYDDAGRLTNDNNRGIAIQYNYLGLVKQVDRNNQTLKNVYDATGRKLQTIKPDNTTRTYIDGIEYIGSTLDFISTPFGRIRKNDADDWVYDYFLRDHLGSVRVALTTDPLNTVTYRATMEEDRAAEENRYFENVDKTRADLPYNYPDRSPTNTKVSKVPGKSEGLKITLKVMAGDTIEISAKAFYNIDNDFPENSVNVMPIIGAILSGMINPAGAASAAGTVLGEGSQLPNNLGGASPTSPASPFPPPSEGSGEASENNLVHPKSGINFVLFNSRFDIVEENTGYLPVDDQINAIQNLATDRLVMKESGYFEIFVNNDAQTPVYYDNMRITHSAGSVLEVNAYYPYGKLIAGLSEQSTYAKNRYKYNEKELIEDLDLQWSDYGARMLDGPMWFVPDRFAESFYHLSPYSFCAGNPINIIDVNGDIIVIITPNGIRVYEFGTTNEDDDEDEFFKRTVKNLNNMYSTSAGSKVIDVLSSSANTFSFTNEIPIDNDGNPIVGTLSFTANENGGGTIKAGSLMTSNVSEFMQVEVVSHELFHGYQHEMGQGGGTIFNEVEAAVFGYAVATDWASNMGKHIGSDTDRVTNSPSGQQYKDAFEKLVYGSTFSPRDFRDATGSFRTGSIKGRSSIYKNHRFTSQTLREKFLLKSFYPLIPKQ
jgi:RHS repeat-associated protein